MKEPLMSALVGFLGGSLAAALMLWLHPVPVTGPPIALLDRGALIDAIEQGGAAADQARQRFSDTKELLKDQGYLVLDPAWVLAAPETLYVDLD